MNADLMGVKSWLYDVFDRNRINNVSGINYQRKRRRLSREFMMDDRKLASEEGEEVFILLPSQQPELGEVVPGEPTGGG